MLLVNILNLAGMFHAKKDEAGTEVLSNKYRTMISAYKLLRKYTSLKQYYVRL